MQILDGHGHGEVLEGLDVVEVFGESELKPPSELDWLKIRMRKHTFELTRCCVEGRSPMGVGLHEPPLTCLPLVMVLPLQKLMKLAKRW
jgi:hypothetical protein